MSAAEQLDRLGNTLAAEIEESARRFTPARPSTPIASPASSTRSIRCPNSSIPIRRGARSRGS